MTKINKAKYYVELFNESCYTLIIILALGFDNSITAVITEEAQKDLGYLTIGIICLVFVVNIFVTLQICATNLIKLTPRYESHPLNYVKAS